MDGWRRVTGTEFGDWLLQAQRLPGFKRLHGTKGAVQITTYYVVGILEGRLTWYEDVGRVNVYERRDHKVSHS